MATVKPIPDGFHTVTPYLTIDDPAAAIEFYKKSFGAEEIMRMPGPDGKDVMHAELKIGNSRIMMSGASPNMGCVSPMTLNGTPVSIHLYVEDTDASFKRAIGAGATSLLEPMNMFWGDRFSKVQDPFGHKWTIATHVEDVPPEQMGPRMKEAFSKMGCPAGS